MFWAIASTFEMLRWPSYIRISMKFINIIFVSCNMYIPREPRRDTSHRLNEHGIYIRYCQESNSQPVPFQVRADPTRPQWRTVGTDASKVMKLKTSYYRHLCHPTSRRGPRSRNLLRFSSHNESLWGPLPGPTSTISVVCDRWDIVWN